MAAASGRRILISIVIVVIAVGGVTLWMIKALEAHRRVMERETQRQNEQLAVKQKLWIAEQTRALRTGQQTSLYFYCTSNTDEMIAEFARMGEIKSLTFELTDLSDDGVRSIVQMPNLAELTLYGGCPRVGDTGLKALAGKQTITTLKLINIDVTNEGLRVLASFPALADLTLYSDRFRQTRWTDAAAQELPLLRKLTTLNIGGRWLSDSALEKLRSDMPDCEIVMNVQW